MTVPLHPWARDPVSAALVLRRHGEPESPEWSLWDAVLRLATSLDDLASDLDAAPAVVPGLAAAVRDLAARLPPSDRPPRRLLLALLEGLDNAAPDDEAVARAALSEALSGAAVSLAALAGAPPTGRDADALRQEAADVLAGLAPVLVRGR